MRVGVYATCWQNNRGYGRHARALLRSLVRLDQTNNYVLFIDSQELAEPLPSRAEVRLLTSRSPTAVAAAANGRRSLRDMWQISRAMSGAELDVLLFPTIYSFVPTFCRARKLVVIHDVIAETYPHLTLPRTSGRLAWKTKVALGRYQADALITVSDYSRRAIVRHFSLSPDRVFVVGEASDPVFRPISQPQLPELVKSLGIDEKHRLVVYVGGFGPHKNLEVLVEAFHGIAGSREFSDVRLVLVGEFKKEVFHSYYERVAALVAQLGLADRSCFTGYLPDEGLAALLNLSTVLVLPSLMEGFGLPAVEAAACGCPVIATKESPLPELLGKGGLYFAPGQKQELQSALENVLSSQSLRHSMREAGLAAAGRLTWDAAARQMMNVITEVAA